MNFSSAEHKLTQRNLTVFAIVVVACGWLGYGLNVAMEVPPGETLGLLLWLVAPLVTALLLRAFAGDGWQDFGLRPNLRSNGLWYLVSLLLYPVVALIILALGAGLGIITFTDFSVARVAAIFSAGFIPAFIKNLFEEFAWRGYLAPKVNALGLNAYVSHVIVGVIWAVWHIPYLLFLLDPTVLQATTTQSTMTVIPQMIIGLVAASVVYGELRLLTASVWPAVLLHTVGNAFVDGLILQKSFQVAPGMEFLFSPAPQSVLTTVLFLAVGVGLHQWRTQQTP